MRVLRGITVIRVMRVIRGVISRHLVHGGEVICVTSKSLCSDD